MAKPAIDEPVPSRAGGDGDGELATHGAVVGEGGEEERGRGGRKVIPLSPITVLRDGGIIKCSAKEKKEPRAKRLKIFQPPKPLPSFSIHAKIP
jgi:hypothetical protein